MNKLDKLFKQTCELQKNRKANAQKNVDDVVSILFAEIPNLNEICVRGWTPGFNDGDPCTHSQETRIDNYDPCGMFNCDDEDSGEETKDTQVDEDTADKAYKIVQALENDFTVLFDTNFELHIKRDAKRELGFRIKHEDYDPGY